MIIFLLGGAIIHFKPRYAWDAVGVIGGIQPMPPMPSSGRHMRQLEVFRGTYPTPQHHTPKMNTTEQTFTEQWAFEHEAKALYPYTNPRKSAAGAPLYDWVATDGAVVATHTLMILKARKTGNPYAVVTREPTQAPPSAELAAILKTAFA
jgi:hypothetical protein